MRARDYNPVTGSFQTVDPALAATGFPYAYAGGDPAVFTDPSGMLALRSDILEGVVIAGGITLAVACASGGCELIAPFVGLDAVLSEGGIRVIGEGLVGAITNIAGYLVSPGCHDLDGYLKAGAVGFLTGAASQGFGEAAAIAGEKSGQTFNSTLGTRGWGMAGGGAFSC